MARGGSEEAEGIYTGNNHHHTKVMARAVEAAERSAEGAWHLMEVLVHEFGHHCDYVLRNEIRAPGEVDPDAPLEEGDALAYAMLHLGFARGARRTPFAQVTRRGRSRELSLDLTRLHALAAGEPDRRFTDPRYRDGKERFAAHRLKETSHGHEDIVREALTELGFPAAHIDRTYFGNWLRDHSQLVGGGFYHQPAESGKILTTDQLTWLLDVLARVHFYGQGLDAASLDVCPDENAPLPAVPAAVTGAPPARPTLTPYQTLVTRTTLGAYASWEHGDNPANLTEDRRVKDARLQRPVRNEDFALDQRLGVLRHIRASAGPEQGDQAFPSAWQYARRQVEIAIALGPSGHGLRHLGNALHVVEDLFAHSNYVEIVLASLPGSKVRTWAVKQGERIPLVTGIYGIADMVASLLELVIPKLQALLDPGNRSLAVAAKIELVNRIIDVMFEAKDVATLQSIEEAKRLWKGLVIAMDTNDALKEMGLDAVAGGTLEGRALAMAWNLVDVLKRELIIALLGAIDIAAIVRGYEAATMPSVEDGGHPTHTQLAKDDDHHPLHDIAAKCAKRATRYIASTVQKAWATSTRSPRTALDAVDQLFRHPFDPATGALGVELRKDVLTWAAGHPKAVEDASNASFTEVIAKELTARLNALMPMLARYVKKGVDGVEQAIVKLWEELHAFWRALHEQTSSELPPPHVRTGARSRVRAE